MLQLATSTTGIVVTFCSYCIQHALFLELNSFIRKKEAIYTNHIDAS